MFHHLKLDVLFIPTIILQVEYLEASYHKKKITTGDHFTTQA